MNTSSKINRIAIALAVFQSAIRPLKKKARGERGGDFFAYAPVDDIIKHVRAALSKQNLYVLQSVTGDIGVTTRLMWTPPEQTVGGFMPVDGRITLTSVYVAPDEDQWIEDTALVSVKGSIEDKGAAITQLRRYSLITMLGLPTVDAPQKKAETAADIIAAKRLYAMTASEPIINDGALKTALDTIDKSLGRKQ